MIARSRIAVILVWKKKRESIILATDTRSLGQREAWGGGEATKDFPAGPRGDRLHVLLLLCLIS